MIPTNKQKTTQKMMMTKSARCHKLTCRRKILPGEPAVVKYGILDRYYYHEECWGK